MTIFPLQPFQINNDAPDLSIVLVCWNNKDYLEPCLNSLYGAGLHSSFDVLVVDNGSKDGSQAMLREKFPQVRIIQNDDNLGLGKASNQGIEASNGKFVLLLNNDTIVNGSSIDAMVEFLEAHPETGAVGGRLLNPDGTVQSCYYNFSTLLEEFLVATRIGEYFRKGYPSNITEMQVKPVDWLCSACLMLRRSALDQVGLLDESYFIYGDEVDLQYRLKEAGWKISYLPDSDTIHYGGRSLDRWRRRKLVYRGKMLFYQKHYGQLSTVLLRILFAGLSLGKLIVWGIAAMIPNWNNRAKLECQSNLEILKLCWKLA
jgi:GT2 family glycosyltransferase